MNVSNRDVLIGYILGRLSQAEAEAVEKQARVDSELAQTLETLRRELSDVGSFPNLRGLPNAFQRRLHTSASSAFSAVRAETKVDDPTDEKKEQTEKTSVASVSTDEAPEEKSNEDSISSSGENSKRASWDSLLSDAFASFANENAEARERAVAKSRKKAKNAEIKPVSVVQTSDRRRDVKSEESSNLNDVQNQANETRSDVDKKSSRAVSLYDVEVRTSSLPVRRRKPFEFIPKQAQAPTRADAFGFTFKHAVANSDEQEKTRRRSSRVEASVPVLGERVVLSRASFDFVDSIPDSSSSLVVCARVLRSKIAFSAFCSSVEDSVSFSLRGGRRSFAGFFTRASVESTVDRAEERFTAFPNAERGNVALCRGTIDADFLGVDVAPSLVETSFWTLGCVDSPVAYLVASLPFASSASDWRLKRRVENALENNTPTSATEETLERTIEAVEDAASSVCEAVPYPETELLAEESSDVAETTSNVDDETSSVSEAVPYPETELLAEAPSAVAETSLIVDDEASSVCEAVPYPETELLEEESSDVAETPSSVEDESSSVCEAVPYPETELLAEESSDVAETSSIIDDESSFVCEAVPYPETELLEEEPSTVAETPLSVEEAASSVCGAVPYPETELLEEESSDVAETSSSVDDETSSVSEAVPYPETELLAEESSVVAETPSRVEEAASSVSEAVPYPETELLAEESSVVAETPSIVDDESSSVSEAVPYPETELSETESSDVEGSISASDTAESISNSPKSRPTFAYPVAPFDVETSTSSAPEYVAPELSAPQSKDEPEPELLEPCESVAEEADETLLQNALIVPQQADSYYASDDAAIKDAEEYGPTLSAEDRRLAELLGHAPTPLELDEFYWEDWDESLQKTRKRGTKPNAAFQILEGVFYVASAPVVLVGRAAIGVGGLFLPRRYEQSVLHEKNRASNKRRKSDALLDVAIPCVVGVLIAIFVVFPILLRSFDYAVSTIGLDIFRKATGKVAVPSAFEENFGAVMSAKIIESQLGVQNKNDAAPDEQVDETQEILVVPNE